MLNQRLLKILRRGLKVNLGEKHGIRHWDNVKKIGKYLAKDRGADIKVIKLFSRLHDIKRENEDYDEEHGLRASEFIKDLYNKKLLKISEKQLEQLMFACKYHSNPTAKSDDITIQTCWDADRLDFWRFGEEPDKDLLYTDIAKHNKTIEFAKKLNN